MIAVGDAIQAGKDKSLSELADTIALFPAERHDVAGPQRMDGAVDKNIIAAYTCPKGELLGSAVVIAPGGGVFPSGLIVNARGEALCHPTFCPGVNPANERPRAGWRRWEDEIYEVFEIDADIPVLPVLHHASHIYGHWLVDLLPRAVLARATVGNLHLAVSENAPRFAYKLLAEFGFESNLIKVPPRALVRARQLVGAPFMRQESFVRSQFSVFRSAALALRCPAEPDLKVYVSRSGIAKRSRLLWNCDEVEQIFRASGFQILHPQNLPLPEQIDIFSKARVLAGEEGSGLHSSVFAPDSCKVIIMKSASNGSTIQQALCDRSGQKTQYLIGAPFRFPGPNRDANFFLDLRQVIRALAA